jgi:hypothetical protein
LPQASHCGLLCTDGVSHLMADVALQRYLERHIEADLPPCPTQNPRWDNVLVIPAYRESAALLQQLAQLPIDSGRTLVILVLNHPDTDANSNANTALREAVDKLKPTSELADERASQTTAAIYTLNQNTELYLHDMDLRGALPAAAGVGLARKTGCDIALKWIAEGAITGPWICSTDADADLPAEYFQRLKSIQRHCRAAVFPFRHEPSGEPMADRATALYELRLHHYVLGLEYAASPYAYHTLGSALAVRATAYAQVRGVPQRAGAEDFYLLNKLAKLGPLAKVPGSCVRLQTRLSDRVPFGTGPAVQSLIEAADGFTSLHDAALFYHPQCFEALRCILGAIALLRNTQSNDLLPLLQHQGLDGNLANECVLALEKLGLDDALDHCRRQGKTPAQFLRQFHQWFDGFKTLKLIHAIRDAGWPNQNLSSLGSCLPSLFPTDSELMPDPNLINEHCRTHWGWQ